MINRVALFVAALTLAACHVEQARADPPRHLDVVPTPICEADSLCYIVAWPAVSDAAGMADGYRVHVTSSAGLDLTATVVDPVYRFAVSCTPGASGTIGVDVWSVRRDSVSHDSAHAAASYTCPDAPPPAPDSVVITPDSVTADPTEDVPPVSGVALATPRDTSPHFDFIRRTFTDFCYCWDGALGAIAREWAARNYDEAMSGNAEAWMALNPTMDRARYTLLWSVLDEANNDPNTLPNRYLYDMREWYAAHPEYGMEDAFLHQRGDTIPADSAHRLNPYLWTTGRFVGNPTDPGWRAYTLDRYRRMAADSTRTGLFVDEMDSYSLRKMIGPAREFTDTLTWQDAIVAQVAEIRAAIAPKGLQTNPAGYGARDLDVRIAIEAGSVHLETMNRATQELPSVWTLVDSLVRRGVYVDMVGLESWSDFYGTGKLSRSSYYPAGLYAAPVYRAKAVQLASYYMVVPSDPQRVGLQIENVRAPLSPDSTVLPVYRYDVGHPTGPRTVWMDARDGLGQRARVYRRDFDNAVILIRPVAYWGDTVMTDTTAMPVPLPEGSWSMVTAGGEAVPVGSLALRNSEAVILVRRPQ